MPPDMKTGAKLLGAFVCAAACGQLKKCTLLVKKKPVCQNCLKRVARCARMEQIQRERGLHMEQLMIQNTVAVQENFLGNNAVYHGYAGLSDTAGRIYDEAFCELEADRAAALGLKVARTYYKWYAYDFEKNCWDWNAPDFEAFCRWAGRMKDRGIDIALNTGWCSPGDILSNSWGGKSPFTVAGDWKKSVEKYAKWVSESVHQLVEVRGLTNVKYLVLFTEPQNGASGARPEGLTAYDVWYDAARAVADRLMKDGRRSLVKLVGPNEGSTVDPKMMQWVHEKDPALLDIYTCHNYLNASLGVSPYNGKLGAVIAQRGGRIQTPVLLKPNTEYRVSAVLALSCKDKLNVSGHLQFGVYRRAEEDGKRLFSAGGQPTTRLTVDSSMMLDPARVNEDWQTFHFSFKTGEQVEDVVAGVFFDVIQKGATLSVGALSVTEAATGAALIDSSSFGDPALWQGVCYSFCSDSDYDTWTMWVQKALSYLNPGDVFWYDEYNTVGNSCDYDEPAHGTELAAARVAFMNSGIQSSLMWTLFDQQWPNNHTQAPQHRYYDGDHRYGIMPIFQRTLKPHPAYYAIQLTGYTGGGMGTRVYAGQGVGKMNLTMTEQPDGTLTVLAVNENDTKREVNIRFETALAGKTLYRYLYDPATVCPDDKATPLAVSRVFEKVTDSITDTLPAGAVVVYTNQKRT